MVRQPPRHPSKDLWILPDGDTGGPRQWSRPCCDKPVHPPGGSTANQSSRTGSRTRSGHIGSGGLVVNAISASLLHRGSQENMNMRAAFLHVVSDAIGSLGAVIAGLLIWLKGVLVADPLISIAIAVLIVYSSWQLIRDAVNVLLEGTPAHIDIAAVIGAMQRVSGIREVHDLHVWTISSGKDALSAHVTIREGTSHKSVLDALHECLRTQFNIGHLTIQVESGDEAQDENVRLYQISRRSENEADAPGRGSSSQSAAARKGEN